MRGPLAALQDVGELVLRPGLFPDAARQRAALREPSHRPWPPPARPWFMGQSWIDLLFAHWRAPPEALREVVPDRLQLDTYDGDAWIGVTPFVVRGLRLRGMPPPPILSTFPEINVRTYVTMDGKPGIYFLSLDADSAAAVLVARRTYRLPYFQARISVEADGEDVSYDSTRTAADGPPARFQARYGPAGGAPPAVEGSLDRWLTERYCLYTFDERQRVLRGEIHHPPWALRPARAEIEANTMTMPFGIELEGEPLLHFSRRQDVVLWTLAPA